MSVFNMRTVPKVEIKKLAQTQVDRFYDAMLYNNDWYYTKTSVAYREFRKIAMPICDGRDRIYLIQMRWHGTFYPYMIESVRPYKDKENFIRTFNEMQRLM